MARRTGVDTLFDNTVGPTIDEIVLDAELEQAMSDSMAGLDAPLDDEDVAQMTEGVPGEFGVGDERAPVPDREYEAAISNAIERAEDYIDSEISPDRELAAKYYQAEKFGNEIEGRSEVVMSEVRDTVLGVLPAMLRIFCGNTNAVEFVNNPGTPQELAEAQTAYINHIIMKDNDGFVIYMSAFKDAFIRKTGIFNWWFEVTERVEEETYTGLNEAAFGMLQNELAESSSEDEYDSYDIEVMDERPDTLAPENAVDFLGENSNPEFAAQNEMFGMEPLPAPQAFIRDVVVRKVYLKKRHRVAAVPPEEFIISPIVSSDLDEYPLVGRRQMKTVGDLVAMGFDEETIRELAGGGGGTQSDAFGYNQERADRVADSLFDTGFENADPSSEYVKYCEIFIRFDRDGDGVLERRRVCTVGDANRIILDEVVTDEVPYAIICPDPEPHAPFGFSIADQTMDLQEIKSEVVRGVLDSLSESIFGRTAVVEGQVNLDDVLSNSRDAIIRMRTPGAVQSLSHPFNGMNAMPVIEYLDTVKARRTGITMSPSGLSPDVLQSTSTEAVQATVDASQERSEMIARIFAETGIKRLYRGLLKQVVRHQDQKRVIRLMGKPVTVDPRAFVADLDLETNVGLGRGSAAKRITGLNIVLAQQKEIMMTMGPANPLVTWHHISNTVNDLVREIGFNDASRYVSHIGADQAEQMRIAAEQAPKEPTPQELLYRAQSEKTQSEMQRDQLKNQTQFAIAQMRVAADKEKADDKFFVDMVKLLQDHGIKVSEQDLRREMEASRDADRLVDSVSKEARAMVPGTNGGNNQ